MSNVRHIGAFDIRRLLEQARRQNLELVKRLAEASERADKAEAALARLMGEKKHDL